MLFLAYIKGVMCHILWAGRKTRVHQAAGKTPAIFVIVTRQVALRVRKIPFAEHQSENKTRKACLIAVD